MCFEHFYPFIRNYRKLNLNVKAVCVFFSVQGLRDSMKFSTGISYYIFFFVVCLVAGPQPLSKRVLQTVRSSASSFSFQYPLVFLMTSGSCLYLCPRLTVTPVLSSIFPSITCFRRQFLRKMWPIQLAFVLFVLYSMFLSSLTLQICKCNFHKYLARLVEVSEWSLW
jgi:hypothetical protein